MQRRVALAVAVAATTSFGVGVVAFGAAGGAHIFGFNGPSGPVGPRSEAIVKHRIETVDQVVVVAQRVPSAAAERRPSNLAALVDAGGHALAASGPISSVPIVMSASTTSASSVLVAPNVVVQNANTTGPVVGTTSSSSQSTGAAVQPEFRSSTSPAGAQAAPNPTPTNAPITASTTAEPLVTATTAAPPPNTALSVTNATALTSSAPDSTVAPETSAAPVATEGRDTTEAPGTTELPAAPMPPATTASTAPTTTSSLPDSATTTTVRPHGVPADWPANKPIPPMPPGCQEPQLEDNGIWNCDH